MIMTDIDDPVSCVQLLWAIVVVVTQCAKPDHHNRSVFEERLNAQALLLSKQHRIITNSFTDCAKLGGHTESLPQFSKLVDIRANRELIGIGSHGRSVCSDNSALPAGA